ncbi:MAG: sigma factor-like helix-turn-helix DNA-binding protein [bacterium]
MKFNYPQICSKLLQDLPERQRAVISRRFGLNLPVDKSQRETLEFIGKDYGITRERVRQIERDGFSDLQPQVQKYQKVFQYFNQYLKGAGGLKKEDLLLEELGEKNQQNQIYFLLSFGSRCQRYGETGDFYPFWVLNQKSLILARNLINSIYNKLEKAGKPLLLKDLNNCPLAFLEISKKIQKGPNGSFGLSHWPEINPRGIKDKAYLVFKEEKKPLHFAQVASFIPASLPQTVHNELIKDNRFVLVGRGLYALAEWGYKQGFVKDVISESLKEVGRPMAKEEIVDKVLKQRLVKENTIILNLSNKKYFSKDSKGFFTLA